MKTRIPVSLSLADTISMPAVSAGLSVEDYLAILNKEASKSNKPKAIASINSFSRWIHSDERIKDKAELIINEKLFADWMVDLKSGIFQSIKEKTYSAPFTQQAPNEVMRIHNILTEHNPLFIRKLVDLRSYPRLVRFNRLTATTRKAMAWYEREGRITPRKPKEGRLKRQDRLQTEQTRRNAISQAFTVMEVFDVNGLELIEDKAVKKYLGIYDSSSVTFRRKCRSLASLNSLVGSCCNNGYLPHNFLTSVPNDSFDEYAVKEFIVPSNLKKLQDLSTVDFNNMKQVVERTVCLCFADLAVRDTELSLLDLKEGRQSLGSYGMSLAPEKQKMHGKDKCDLNLFYDSTARILKYYLETRKGDGDNTPLFLNERGGRASGAILRKMVKSECSRLGVYRYHDSKKHPRPHDLRRTFGMCNIKPFGLKLEIHDIAERLRDGYEVTRKHYLHKNPLLSAMKAEKYREQSQTESSPDVALQGIELLRKAKVPEHLISSISHHIEKTRPNENNTPEYLPSGNWVAEEFAIEQFQQAWRILPFLRSFRKYLRQNKIATPSGARGSLQYDAKWVAQMIKEYIPLEQIVEPLSLRPRQLYRLADSIPDCLNIGHFNLVPKNQTHILIEKAMKMIPNKNMGSGKTSKGHVVKSARVA